MPDIIAKKRTHLPPEEVMVRAVQFFSNESWRAQSQTNRIATFVGVPRIPWVRLMIMVFLYFCFILPGIIYQFMVIRRMRRLQNIVVTTSPLASGCEVVVTFAPTARKLVTGFLEALPLAQAAEA